MVSLTPRQWFWLALAATLGFRFWLGAALPITGDEAYFAIWGRHPDIGFYDHPPMVGWLLAPLVLVSDSAWVLRLPAILLPAALALLLRHALSAWFARDADTADLAALAVLLLPINVWNVLVTTDTPLALFSLASLLAFARQRFLLAGVLLGLAFLSKYFAVLLGLGVWQLQRLALKQTLLAEIERRAKAEPVDISAALELQAAGVGSAGRHRPVLRLRGFATRLSHLP